MQMSLHSVSDAVTVSHRVHFLIAIYFYICYTIHQFESLRIQYVLNVKVTLANGTVIESIHSVISMMFPRPYSENG